MTNKELMEQFMAGDESVLTKLCKKNEGLNRSCAKEIAQSYNCIQYTQRGKLAMVRKAQRLHHVEYMDANEIAAELNISEEDAVRHIGYGTHFHGIDNLTGYYDDVDAYDYLLEDESTTPPKQVIYKRIRMEYFKELFDALPKRDKDILGK